MWSIKRVSITPASSDGVPFKVVLTTLDNNGLQTLIIADNPSDSFSGAAEEAFPLLLTATLSFGFSRV